MKDADGEMLGGGIADFDTASGEMSLEWIQVLPAFRRLGYGKRIVDELLRRGREIAAFATVCGKSENRAAERLYRGCGFTGGEDVWYVIRKT